VCDGVHGTYLKCCAQGAERALAMTTEALAAEAKADEAHAAALSRHIEGLRMRESQIEGPPDRVLRDLVDVTSALALAEANLTQWRARDAPARASVREGKRALYVAARDKSMAPLARARAANEVASLANGTPVLGCLLAMLCARITASPSCAQACAVRPWFVSA
jgi:hypothetical protein